MTPRPRKRGRPPGDTAAATRAGLLRSAREVFAERGYAAATTAEIVERAGVSPSVMYHHFGSKAALYLAALTEVYDILLGAYESAIEGRDDFSDRLHAVLAANVPVILTDPNLGPFVVLAQIEARRYPDLAGAQPLFRRAREVFERIAGGDDAGRIGLCNVLIGGLATYATPSRTRAEYDAVLDAIRAYSG